MPAGARFFDARSAGGRLDGGRPFGWNGAVGLEAGPVMSILNCPSCGGRTPAAAVTGVHCGALAPTCRDCAGSGVCRRCRNVYPKVAGCKHCAHSGNCPKCAGRKRAWDTAPPKKGG